MTENEKAYRSAGRRRRARPLDLVHMRHVALDHLRGRSLVLMRSITLLAVALAVAFSSVPADAITPATPDGTGHPSVGILVAEWKTPGVKDRICSGTLIAPRIFLTSAHCDVSDVGVPPDQYWVSFDPVYQFDASTLYQGTFVANPDFIDYHNAGPTGRDPHDVAIVRLNQSPPVTPAALPPAGLLNSLDLTGQSFTTVGYGRTRIDRTKGPKWMRQSSAGRSRNGGPCTQSPSNRKG